MKRQSTVIFSLLWTALLGVPLAVVLGEPFSVQELVTQLINLNVQGRFDESQAKVSAYLKEEPGDGDMAYGYAEDLIEKHHQNERGIAFINLVLPSFEKTDPIWAGRLANRLGIAIAFGRYGKTQRNSDLAEAKSAFMLAARLNPHIYEAHFHLGIINTIQGNAEQAKFSFNRAIETSTNPDQTAFVKSLVAIIEGGGDFENLRKVTSRFYMPH